MSVPVVLLDAVTKSFPGSPPVTALDGISLEVARGEHVAVVGPSGSGKTTLLGIIGLLDRPDSGTYLLEGIDASALTDVDAAHERAHRIGFVFQAYHLLANRSVEDNVALAGVYRRVPRRQRRRDAMASLERVGMAHRRCHVAATLSGGERQRVAIARAVTPAPPLLLCDEPTGNLDEENTHVVLDLLDGLRRDGITIITITHDPVVAARSDRVVHLRAGRLSATTTRPP